MTLYCSQGHFNSADSRFCRLCGEPLQLAGGSSLNNLTGQLLGWRYRVLSELGHGGFGRTYLAEDAHRFNERCVLKEFAPQVQGDEALQKAEELFAREAGILYQLQHPQIPRFRELLRTEWQGRDRLFLVQDYVEGQTYQEILQSRLRQGQVFSEAQATQLLLQLLPVLDYIHRCGVIHRDISPDNLILRTADNLPVLIDFGGVKQVAAKVLSSSRPAVVPVKPRTITRLGKLGYAPVEQMEQGEVYPHSDLYALAITALVLLTGKEPQVLFDSNGTFGRRPWQRQVALSPTMSAVLNRMIDPYPAKRYQSAQAVLYALGSGGLKPDSETSFPPVQPIANFTPDPDVAAGVSPPIGTHATVSIPSAKPVRRRSGLRSGLRTVAGLLVLSGMIVGGWWAGVKWLGPALKSKLPEIVRPKPTNKPANPSQPNFSTSERERKRQIDDRRQQLGIDTAFLVNLVNEAFYRKHPELAGQKLGTGAGDTGLRAEWDQIALQSLERLEALSSEARSRLGSYTEADLRSRQDATSQLNLSSRALNDLTDAKFFHLFPEQPEPDNVVKLPMGQVWQAIAADQLKALQAGKTLERIEFPSDNFSHRISGTLKPGDGKAYTANLSVNQTLRLQLQAANQPVRLSLYPPSSKSPALLEDSQETTWSGKLTEPGFYEITVISNSRQPINYTIDLAAADDVTAPSTQ
ncbi:MAG: serine/threonine protein kinase [Leptolyngbyaceae cyanobacterium RU_5_1]|nr:serine/threonine protein kinase [Leptolyngbyaceae cyanobacterium RU_5_1]